MIGQILARCRSATSFGPVCDQDTVMEFGLNTQLYFTTDVVAKTYTINTQ